MNDEHNSSGILSQEESLSLHRIASNVQIIAGVYAMGVLCTVVTIIAQLSR